MEVGQFNNMNEVISKFVNSCTEATRKQNAILHFRSKYNQNNYRRNKKQFPKNFNQQRPNNGYNNRNQRENRNYVRATECDSKDSENYEAPI